MIKGKHYAFYGTKRLERMYCKACEGMTIVVDNVKLCCDTAPESIGDGCEYMVASTSKRHKPSAKQQKKILFVQENRCLYCGKPFGSEYRRKGRTLFTKIHYDHLVPFSYSRSCDDSEFVAACNICNNIKSNKLFETVKEVFYYVEHKRKSKGYYYPEEKEIF